MIIKRTTAFQSFSMSITDLAFCVVSRFFVLNNEAGLLEYFVNEQSRHQKPRGTLPLAGAVISPSDEDSHTFTVNAISGEQYKLRGVTLFLSFSFSYERTVWKITTHRQTFVNSKVTTHEWGRAETEDTLWHPTKTIKKNRVLWYLDEIPDKGRCVVQACIHHTVQSRNVCIAQKVSFFFKTCFHLMYNSASIYSLCQPYYFLVSRFCTAH